MNSRPKSVTVICWFLIVTGCLSLVTSAMTYDNPDIVKVMELSTIPVSIQYMLMIVGVAITTVSGIGMLYGKNFARILYVGWSLLAIVFSLLTSPVKAMMTPAIFVFLIITFFLFRKNSNIYFSDNDEVESVDS
jgi:multisubunit Na+/H+ antiporter MnhG subunit